VNQLPEMASSQRVQAAFQLLLVLLVRCDELQAIPPPSLRGVSTTPRAIPSHSNGSLTTHLGCMYASLIERVWHERTGQLVGHTIHLLADQPELGCMFRVYMQVRCDVLREGKRLSVTVTLGERGAYCE
jgi:hypothetical protein